MLPTVGDQFSDINGFKHAMKSIAVQEGYQYATAKSDQARARLKCKEDGCLWTLHARREKESTMFKISATNPVHNCNQVVH
jgi:hypothetical protein